MAGGGSRLRGYDAHDDGLATERVTSAMLTVLSVDPTLDQRTPEEPILACKGEPPSDGTRGAPATFSNRGATWATASVFRFSWARH
jgi:hypothetical protein